MFLSLSRLTASPTEVPARHPAQPSTQANRLRSITNEEHSCINIDTCRQSGHSGIDRRSGSEYPEWRPPGLGSGPADSRNVDRCGLHDENNTPDLKAVGLDPAAFFVLTSSEHVVRGPP